MTPPNSACLHERHSISDHSKEIACELEMGVWSMGMGQSLTRLDAHLDHVVNKIRFPNSVLKFNRRKTNHPSDPHLLVS